MKVMCGLLLCVNILCAQEQLTKLMQDMEYALNLIQKGFLYNNKKWLNDGLEEFKVLNRELRRIDPNAYLPIMQRRDVNVVGGIVNMQSENLKVLERFLNKNDILKSTEAYGRIVSGCVSCHSLVRSNIPK